MTTPVTVASILDSAGSFAEMGLDASTSTLRGTNRPISDRPTPADQTTAHASMNHRCKSSCGNCGPRRVQM